MTPDVILTVTTSDGEVLLLTLKDAEKIAEQVQLIKKKFYLIN
jgi:hypothetical protein